MGGCAAKDVVRVRPVIYNSSSIDDPDSIDTRNLELYYLFWLDRTVRSPEYIETQDELRGIINYLKIFEQNNECIEEFGNVTKGKIFLLVNCVQSISLLPIIHDHKRLHSIYIYHTDDKTNMEDISRQYKKIKGVYDSFIMAKRYLEDDIEIHTDFDEPMVIDLLDTNDNTDYQEKFTLLLKTIHVHANNIYDIRVRHHLIDTCTPYYQRNKKEIDVLKDFYQSYKPENAISWYIRDCCLHRILSRAFIQYDISLLANMYSLIVDINRNVQQQMVKSISNLRVYRGQFLSKEKLNQLKANQHRIITMQCFFSAQTSREETLDLLEKIEPIEIDNQRILFEIDISKDYVIVNNDQISSTSKTILFKLATQFQIVEVTDTTVLLSQYNSSINTNEELAYESPLIIRGLLTYLKDGPIQAIKYYEEILRKQSSVDLTTDVSIYGQLGYLKHKAGNLGGATKMYEQAITCARKPFDLHLFYLEQAAQYHSSILDDWQKAMTLWLQKLNIQNALLLKEEKVQTYENLAKAALKTEQPDQAFEYITAAIDNLPNNHPYLPRLRQQLESIQNNSSKKPVT